MQQLVRVRQTHEDGTATVIHVRESACSGDCHKCSGCGAAKEAILLEAKNPIGAKLGDLVIIESETGPVLKAAAILYIMPLLLFLAGYIAGGCLGYGAGWLGAAGFLLGIAGVVWYDRRTAKKKNTIYTITGFAA